MRISKIWSMYSTLFCKSILKLRILFLKFFVCFFNIHLLDVPTVRKIRLLFIRFSGARKNCLSLKVLQYIMVFDLDHFRDPPGTTSSFFFFFENGLVDVISNSKYWPFYLIKNLRAHPSTTISWDIGINTIYFSIKLYDIY